MEDNEQSRSAPGGPGRARTLSGRTTLVDILMDWAARRSRRPALVFLDVRGQEKARLTYGVLDAEARGIAARLAGVASAGARALLLFPPGLEFVTAFFGCLYAGIVAVPVTPPRSAKDGPRLQGVVESCRPSVVLSTGRLLGRIEPILASLPNAGCLPRLVVEEAAGAEGSFRPASITGESLAFLQYTSGSTGRPRGVMVSHDNLVFNEAMLRQAFEHHEDHTVLAGWLPLYHDMGLIGVVLQSVYLGAPCYLLSPLDFLLRPAAWLEIISRYRVTTSGAPSFAYELCARRVTVEQAAALDLSSWDLAFNGAEPVRAEVIERFTERFAPYGFRREAFYPCYGLAEATLFVTGGAKSEAPHVIHVDRAALGSARVQPAEGGSAGALALVGCGHAWHGHEIAVVDAATSRPCSPDQIGEIWVRGPSVARGYWSEPVATRATFAGRLADGADDGEGGAAPDATEQSPGREPAPWLRTGDLGFVASGELYVVGRSKDLVIVRGRKHHPEDIERTVEEATAALQAGGGAAFGVDVDGEERLVIVHEVARDHLAGVDAARLSGDVQEAVTLHHGVGLHALVLVKPGAVPKTTSGKVQRGACRAQYLEGRLERIDAAR
jgi:acyl-CoA synthetase (AMP-forming)/AMP-acid ligase II